MNTTSLQTFIEAYKKEIDQRLPLFIENLSCPGRLKDAMLYSLNAGGKRVRPLLMLATIATYRDIEETDYQVACALECIHTYSLIHDDLPAMDDDDFRRGKPTNHRVFGEAMAILAGDGLLTRAFELVSTLEGVSPEVKMTLVQQLAEASGAEGMVGGQVADLEGEKKELELKELEYIHHHKTGALLRYAIVAGAILAKATEEDIFHLRTFSEQLGLVFQIKDDILDVEGNPDQMGKAIGSDESKLKSTYPRLLSLEGAKEKLQIHADQALSSLHSIEKDVSLLAQFVEYITNRSH